MAEHDFFGVIDETGGQPWREIVLANDQRVEVSVWMEHAADPDDLDRAAAMVMSLDAIDNHAREQFVAELSSSHSPTSRFVADALSGIDDEELYAALNRDSGDRAIDILRSLTLDSATIRPDQGGDDEEFCLLRYHFVPDVFAEVLVAILDARAESADIRIESW